MKNTQSKNHLNILRDYLRSTKFSYFDYSYKFAIMTHEKIIEIFFMKKMCYEKNEFVFYKLMTNLKENTRTVQEKHVKVDDDLVHMIHYFEYDETMKLLKNFIYEEGYTYINK